ncbi:MAG: hypothetical protein IJV71_05740 [Lachnospiraceae bacterium]|nr:hypothetical protein [Lachnospiraceae bacterium]
MSLQEQILNEVTLYCRDECSSSCECPEDECVLFRIERLVVESDMECND